jgi:hypothetical protein
MVACSRAGVKASTGVGGGTLVIAVPVVLRGSARAGWWREAA